MFALSRCSTQEEMAPKPAPAPAPAAKAEAKAPRSGGKASEEKAAEKAKATKLAGDVGLLDTEKNYMILVTKEGKLVTLDFDAKFQPTQKEPVAGKVADIGLGSSAMVQYTKEGEKNIAPISNLCRPRASKTALLAWTVSITNQEETEMKANTMAVVALAVLLAASLALPVIAQEEKKAEKKAEEKKGGTGKSQSGESFRRYRSFGYRKKLHDRRHQRRQVGHVGLQRKDQGHRN